MSPNRDSTFLQPLPNKPSNKLSVEPLQRTISDISFELIAREALTDADESSPPPLPPIPEVEDAKCECCGMCEECTPQYVKKVIPRADGVRPLLGGGERGDDEKRREGGRLHAHVSACTRFNRVQAMREVLRNSRAKSLSPRDKNGANAKKGEIARSSSCIPAIAKETSGRKTA